MVATTTAPREFLPVCPTNQACVNRVTLAFGRFMLTRAAHEQTTQTVDGRSGPLQKEWASRFLQRVGPAVTEALWRRVYHWGGTDCSFEDIRPLWLAS